MFDYSLVLFWRRPGRQRRALTVDAAGQIRLHARWSPDLGVSAGVQISLEAGLWWANRMLGRAAALVLVLAVLGAKGGRQGKAS